MEIIRLAFDSLKNNKLRSALTMLGIIVGIFSIILISTIVAVLQNSIEEGVSMLGQNTFQIQKFPILIGAGPGERAKFRNRKDITLEEYEAFKEKLVEAKSVGAEQWSFGKVVKFGNKETNPNIQFAGTTPEAFPNNKWNIDSGRLFSNQDIHRYERYIILGADVATTLFKSIDPIGQEIKVDGYNLKVLGVLEKQGAMFGQSQDNFAVIPITTFQNMYGKRGQSINITVMAYDDGSYEDLLEKAEGYMRMVRKVPPLEDNDFDIFSNKSVLGQIDNITKYVKLGAIIIAAIALLAAGVGIMNIMLVSVTERTKEIGVRKAVGAKKLNILFQFITEAIVLCLFGGAVGIFLGVALGNLAGTFLNASAVIPIDWVIIGVLLCITIGVTFGTYPAYKAANLDPIESLRYE